MAATADVSVVVRAGGSRDEDEARVVGFPVGDGKQGNSNREN